MKCCRFVCGAMLLTILTIAQVTHGNPICSQAHGSAVPSFLKYSPIPFHDSQMKLKALQKVQAAKIDQLLAKISKSIPLEPRLVAAIENDLERPQISMLNVKYMFGHSQQFRSLSAEEVDEVIHELARIVPSDRLEQEIKAYLYMILDKYHLVTDTSLQADILNLMEEVHTVYVLRSKSTALYCIQWEMPEIQNVTDYQRALFALPAQIRAHLPVADSQLKILSQFSQDYLNDDIKNPSFISSIQEQARKNLEGFLNRTSPFQEAPPSYRNAIKMRYDQMGTPEEAALAVAFAINETGQASVELQTLVRHYQALNLVRPLLAGAGLLITPSPSTPH